MAKVTLKDVAKRANVSIGTVSRVINNYTNVKPEIRARVQKAIEEIGFEPNIFAQAIRGGKSKLIGVIVQDITSITFARFVQTTQRILSEAGYMLVLAPSYNNKDTEMSLLRAFVNRKVDGIIMTSSDEDDQNLVEARARLDVPVVLFDRKRSQNSEDAVLIDHHSGMVQAMRYLLDLGHTRIALLTGKGSVHPARDRIRGYEDAMRERGLSIDASLIRAVSFEARTAFIEASKLLSADAPPTAIVAGGTALLGGVLQAAQVRGLRIPEDLSVIASSDTNLAALANAPISVIRWDSDEVARAASNLLVSRLAEDKNAEKPERSEVYIPTEFLIRASCKSPMGLRNADHQSENQ